jgi:hypothetical protein
LSRSRWRRYASMLPKCSILLDLLPALLLKRTAASPLPSEDDYIVFDGDQMVNGLHLQSSRKSERLNQIDRVRANGIGDHIALPQLVVCGDQSVGKSWVLEGISGIPFPRQDGLCTRFATQIVLRHDLSE